MIERGSLFLVSRLDADNTRRLSMLAEPGSRVLLMGAALALISELGELLEQSGFLQAGVLRADWEALGHQPCELQGGLVLVDYPGMLQWVEECRVCVSLG